MSVNFTDHVTFSFTVKPAGYTRFGIREQNATGAYAVFDLAGSGTVIESGIVSADAFSFGITALTGGAYRVHLSVSKAGGTFSSPRMYVLPVAASYGNLNSYSWAGNGTDGVEILNAQGEDGTTLTNYQPIGAVSPANIAWLGVNHAVAPSDAARPLLQASGGIYWIKHDLSDDALIVTLPNFGTDATVIYAADTTITTLTGQTIGAGEYTLPQVDKLFAHLMIDRALSPAETAFARRWMSQKSGIVI
jgi:hypothetical protein